MYKRLAVVLVASTIGLGACTTAGGTPATAPPVSEAPVTMTIAAPTTTTMPITSTTVDRLSEIQAIFQDLEVRRLQAIMDDDEEAFRAVFANDEYGERSLVLIDEVVVIDADAAVLSVAKVLADGTDCIAVSAIVDASESIEAGGVGEPSVHVVELHEGEWGISWVGSGWECDGSHPFSG